VSDVRLIRIVDITIGDRTRTLDANITPLAADVARNGVREPIIVTGDGQLVDGWRRIQAANRCGLDKISSFTVNGISEIADIVAGQPAGEPMCYPDAMRCAELLIELDQDAAAERRIARSAAAGRGERPAVSPVRITETVAMVIGWSRSTFGRGIYMWRRAASHRDLVAALDAGTISVNHAYGQARAADIAKGQPPPSIVERGNPADQHRAVRTIAAQCKGIAHGIRSLGVIDELPQEDAARLAADLKASRTDLTRLINQLERETNRA
jgi:ParB family chromosome partitioning protein